MRAGGCLGQAIEMILGQGGRLLFQQSFDALEPLLESAQPAVEALPLAGGVLIGEDLVLPTTVTVYHSLSFHVSNTLRSLNYKTGLIDEVACQGVSDEY